MFWEAIPIIGSVLKKGLDVIDQLVEDKDMANRLKAEFEQQALALNFDAEIERLKQQASIVLAETQGQSWLQRNWRPTLMLVVVGIVANNYLLFPYLSLFMTKVVMLDLPDHLWNLMNIGVGGYVVGRSAEKVAEVWKKKD